MTREQLQQFINAVLRIRAVMTDEQAFSEQSFFPEWHSDKTYSAGDRVRYVDNLYKCLQAHEAQASWMPDVSPSLWVRIDDPAVEWPEWIQPVGSADAYAKGAKVSHNEKHWISDVDANIWEPGAVGTEALWHEVV